MYIRLEQPPKNIKTKLPNDEEIRPNRTITDPTAMRFLITTSLL